MHYGFIKVAAATPEIIVADCAANSASIVALLNQAQDAGVKLVVFPELTLTSYTCGDLFLQPTLLKGTEAALGAITEATSAMDLVAVIGAPLIQQGKLYNCAVVLHHGKILGVIPKKNLPNYGEFYELRHFTPAPSENSTISLNGQTVPFGSRLLFVCQQMPAFSFAAEICEDLWAPAPPSIGHALHGASIICNLSASNEIIGKTDYRKQLVTNQSARLLCGYIYASAGEGESTTDLVFSGHNLVAEKGSLLAESPLFSTGLTISEIDVQKMAYERRRQNTFLQQEADGYQTIYFTMPLTETPLTRHVSLQPFVPEYAQDRAQRCETILSIQAQGLKKRLAHTHAQTAVVGISGGLDSCLALLVTVRAMDLLKRPHTDIVAVTMPCFGTTSRTKNNAEMLCQHLGVTFRTIDIGPSVEQHFKDIQHPFDDYSVTFENSQARERTQVLMDIANQTGGMVIGTGDLSELALGWATYNGDHMSMYGVNSSIPKTLVQHIVHYAAETAKDKALQDVLLDILDTPVSPELLPADKDGNIAQKTEDLVGPYALHDFFLYYALRWAYSPKKIYYLARYAFGDAYDEETILHWLKTFYRRFFNQQFKRSCLPDGPKIGSVALSPRGDWRMPSDAAAALWLKELNCL